MLKSLIQKISIAAGPPVKANPHAMERDGEFQIILNIVLFAFCRLGRPNHEPWRGALTHFLSQWVCQLTFNQKLGFSTPPYNLYGEAKKVLALCVAVLTVQLSTDFGTSEIHCLENQVLNSTKYNVSKSVLLSTDFLVYCGAERRGENSIH